MIKEGLSYISSTVVTDEKCAASMGSGNLMVFATPAMIALAENAAMMAVADSLPAGSTTVGGGIDMLHLRPSGVGATIEATATVTSVEGRKISYELKVCDANGVIGEGTHVRFVVDIEKFMQKIAEKG